MKRVRSCVRACGVVEVARDKTSKDEVGGEEHGRGERGEIRWASFEQDLSGVLSVREVESESAVHVRGRDLLSKILGERFGVFRSVLGREKGRRRRIRSGSGSWRRDIDAQRVCASSGMSRTMTRTVSMIKFGKSARKRTAWLNPLALQLPPVLQAV
jgi:hypothetical protein